MIDRTGINVSNLEASKAFYRAALAPLGYALRLALSTATTNVAAQSLYRSLGWQRDEQFLVYESALPC